MIRQYEITAAIHTTSVGRSQPFTCHNTHSVRDQVGAHDMCQAMQLFKDNCWDNPLPPSEISIRELPCKPSQEQNT